MDQASRVMSRLAGKNSDVFDSGPLVCRSWKKAVGPKLAQKTRAQKLVRKKLVIEVQDEVWQYQLHTLSGYILRNLARAIGPGIVEELEFRVMPLRIEAQRETERAMPLFDGLPDEAESIVDPMLRRIYRNARRRETA